jgi:hypothetical protein
MLPSILLQISRFEDPALRWTIICLVLLVAVYLILRPKMKKKDPLERRQQQPSPPGGLTLAQQRGLERDMSTLVTELLDMSRQMTAQMETRAAKLEILLKEADDKIAQLHALTSHAQNGDGQPAASSAPAASAPPAASQSATDPRYERIYALAAQGQSIPQIAREVGMPSGEIEVILAFWRTSTGKG